MRKISACRAHGARHSTNTGLHPPRAAGQSCHAHVWSAFSRTAPYVDWRPPRSREVSACRGIDGPHDKTSPRRQAIPLGLTTLAARCAACAPSATRISRAADPPNRAAAPPAASSTSSAACGAIRPARILDGSIVDRQSRRRWRQPSAPRRPRAGSPTAPRSSNGSTFDLVISADHPAERRPQSGEGFRADLIKAVSVAPIAVTRRCRSPRSRMLVADAEGSIPVKHSSGSAWRRAPWRTCCGRAVHSELAGSARYRARAVSRARAGSIRSRRRPHRDDDCRRSAARSSASRRRSPPLGSCVRAARAPRRLRTTAPSRHPGFIAQLFAGCSRRRAAAAGGRPALPQSPSR